MYPSYVRTPALGDVLLELGPEHLEGGDDGDRRRWAEEADRRHLVGPGQTGRDVLRHVVKQVEVLLAAHTLLDAPHHLLEPAGALAARRALAARLHAVEAGHAPGGP